jgi:hypothetical protein
MGAMFHMLGYLVVLLATMTIMQVFVTYHSNNIGNKTSYNPIKLVDILLKNINWIVFPFDVLVQYFFYLRHVHYGFVIIMFDDSSSSLY